MPPLEHLPDDVLIHLFTFLSISEILTIRQTCKRFMTLSKLHVVWHHACISHILNQGFPFPPVSIEHLQPTDLERLTRHAYSLGQFWCSPASTARPRSSVKFSASSGMPVSDVRFIPSHPGWLITVSKGIWSVITCWDVGPSLHGPARKLAEWSPKGAVFTAVTVNSDPEHKHAMLAVSTVFPNEQRVDLLRVRPGTHDDGSTSSFECLATISSSFKALNLCGDLLAIGDDMNEVHIINWLTGDMAVLLGTDEPSESNFQHNRCLQIHFSPRSIFVVRARSFEAFSIPTLTSPESITEPYHPIARHRFGWIDGVAVAQGYSSSVIGAEDDPQPAVSIVLRAESDDPWSSDKHTLDLYHLPEAAEAEPPDLSDVQTPESPYVFPPLHHASLPSARGHLRCKDISLGSHGTALWIQPRPSRNTDLTGFDVHASDVVQGQGVQGQSKKKEELLVATVFPGRMKSRNEGMIEEEEGVLRTLWAIEDVSMNWTSMDYDEAGGVVALGDSHGKVEVLLLVP
ncbi:hypothetical protein BC835DRAFT_1296405 [Cytidiella melzeri]|nr:hypothetical protein BC835DRAFT_1296405 [Cytidiella melzeri]